MSDSDERRAGHDVESESVTAVTAAVTHHDSAAESGWVDGWVDGWVGGWVGGGGAASSRWRRTRSWWR